MTGAALETSSTAVPRQVWLELVKAFAIVWIFLNHLVERIFGFPYIANPTASWPPLATRIDQLQPLGDYGLWNIPVNLLRYVGWFGDQGVQLFLIASGFGITWSLLHRSAPDRLAVVPFYWSRAARIYPLWWTLHVVAGFALLLVKPSMVLADPRFVLSAVGIRVTPDSLYYLVPAWWFVGCLLQLYLVFPLLWWLLRRRGPAWLMVVVGGSALAVRGAGLLSLHAALDAWARGAWCITRLPEIVFGMCFAAVLYNDGSRVMSFIGRNSVRLLCLLVYGVGTLLSLSLIGNTVSPLLLGGSVFVLLAGAWRNAPFDGIVEQSGLWLGRHSYGLFLVHQPIVNALIPRRGSGASHGRLILASVACVVLTLVATRIVEAVAGAAPSMARALRSRSQVRRIVVGGLSAALAFTWIGEAYVQRLNPQEVFGWGERPALMPDARVGWKLKPNQETRLRWECYDYLVSANALGFPGPLYPENKAPGALRILTVGDAFTSAEGVDTGDAWPRRLEAGLRARLGTSVEVLNFAITGYGPNQYGAAIESFAPRYRPDLIMVGIFMNDLDDVLRTTEGFHSSIGFGRPEPQGWLAFLTAAHLRRLISLGVIEWISENVYGRPGPHGFFLGQFETIRQQPEKEKTGKDRLKERLSQIGDVALQIGAEVILVMIPAPAQICGRDSLAYYPRKLNLEDSAAFDLERPQRLIREVAEQLSLPAFDLRPVLLEAPVCPYFGCNMHWTADGHRIVADTLVDYVIARYTSR